LSEGVAEKLRTMGMRCRTVQVWFRSNDLSSFGRQLTLPRPTLLSSELTDAAMQLLRAHYHWERPLRSVGIRAMNLVAANQDMQLSLFEDESQRLRREALEATMDDVRRRFGRFAIDFCLLGVDKRLGALDIGGAHEIYPKGYL